MSTESLSSNSTTSGWVQAAREARGRPFYNADARIGERKEMAPFHTPIGPLRKLTFSSIINPISI